jgi:hypothetical protein
VRRSNWGLTMPKRKQAGSSAAGVDATRPTAVTTATSTVAAAICANTQQFSRQMQAQHDQFMHDQAVRQTMHEQFLATMQRGTDASMARTQQSMNARSTAASDWVDYALDKKTVADPNTGQISKVSNSYTHTWVDSTGKTTYQTNDSNANPNGVLPGNWTQQQTVHGDGTPQ